MGTWCCFFCFVLFNGMQGILFVVNSDFSYFLQFESIYKVLFYVKFNIIVYRKFDSLGAFLGHNLMSWWRIQRLQRIQKRLMNWWRRNDIGEKGVHIELHSSRVLIPKRFFYIWFFGGFISEILDMCCLFLGLIDDLFFMNWVLNKLYTCMVESLGFHCRINFLWMINIWSRLNKFHHPVI